MLLKRSKKKLRKIVIPTKENSGPSKKSKETVVHLEEGWLPVNPILLEKIQNEFEEGVYEEDPSLLIENIKKDPGLFFHVAKNLKSYIPNEKRIKGFDPISQLRTLETEKISEIFRIEPEKLTPLHAQTIPSPSQSSLTQLGIISATTAETIADRLQLESDHAYSNSLFRQLGVELISWNYPLIFSRALMLHRTKGEPIDGYLKRTLGIAPSQISIKFARLWSMSSEIEKTIHFSDRANSPEAPIETDLSEMTIAQICQFSDLYAKSKDPINFPKAQDMWAAKENALKDHIGQDIIEELEDNTKIILEESQQRKQGPLGATKVRPSRKNQAFQKNQYLKKLPEWIQDSFIETYKHIHGNEIALDAIRLMVEKVVPETGFIRGCLYMKNKDTLELEPALRFGDVPLEKYKWFLSHSQFDFNSLLFSNAPMKQRSKGINGVHTHQISGSLKDKEHPGVLYLEISEKAESDSRNDSLSLFHAISKTLSDCLKK